jgi:hypothetical protein
MKITFIDGMGIAWVYGNEEISFDKTYAWLILGVRGSGKSCFLEHLAECHLRRGNAVLDLFGAKSGEGLAWLRSDWINEKKILLLHGENAIIETNLNVDFKKVSEIKLRDFEDYDIIINASPLYKTIDDEFNAVNILIDMLWRRLEWHKIIFVLTREGANLLYSRQKIAENQNLAKNFLIYWLRESRHIGCSLGVDSQRLMALDIDVRNVCDILVFKALGHLGLPHEFKWVYRQIEPSFMRRMEPYQFVISTRKGDLGIGTFPLVKWHAKEGEGLLTKLGLKITFEEKPLEAISRGIFKTIGDIEHTQIIEMYIEQEMSMRDIAKQLDRSSASILMQIDKHNNNIEKMGYCPMCRRAKSKFETMKAEKERII